MLLHTIRRNLPRLGRFHAALFVVLWATMVASPCVMAMQGKAEPVMAHDCPHCPPKPCHESTTSPDCDETDPADRLRTIDGSQLVLALPAGAPDETSPTPAARAAPPGTQVRNRDGPRPHLLHVRFDE